MSLSGQVAIVTGAASGIGRALSRALAARGARVVVTDINGEGAETVARDLGAGASAHRVDVCDADAVQRLVVDTRTSCGRIDYIFNNAGIAVLGEVLDTPLEDWYRVFDINVRGVVHGIAAAYPLMVEQGHGHIVNIASVAGLIPAPGLTAYAGTKHAVVGISKSLRIEAAQYGVNVSAVCPGFVKTNIVAHASVRGMEREDAASVPPFWYDVDDCARDILAGVARNAGIIVVTGHAKQFYRLSRFAPRVMDWLAAVTVRRRQRANR